MRERVSDENVSDDRVMRGVSEVTCDDVFVMLVIMSVERVLIPWCSNTCLGLAQGAVSNNVGCQSFFNLKRSLPECISGSSQNQVKIRVD